MKYFKVLGFNKDPFSDSPDPVFFFKTQPHLECVQQIELSTLTGRGVSVVLGESGVGKSILCQSLVDLIPDESNINICLLRNDLLESGQEFLQEVALSLNILRDISGELNQLTDVPLKKMIRAHLDEQYQADNERHTLLVIDNGECLPSYCFELLCELTEYEIEGKKPLQVVIFGLPELKEKIISVPKFSERVALYYSLAKQNFKGLRDLIQYRINLASEDSRSDVSFSWLAYKVIYHLSQGIPRRAINICHQMLVSLAIKKQFKAGGRTAIAAASKLGRSLFSPRQVFGLMLAVVIGITLITGAYFYFSCSSDTQKTERDVVKIEVEPVVKLEPVLPKTDKTKALPLEKEISKNKLVAVSPSSQVSTTQERIHLVEKYETIWEIIVEAYGPNAYTESHIATLMKANPHVTDPALIHPGTKIYLPELEGISQ